MKKVREKNFLLHGHFRQFSKKNVHIWDHFFPLLFPKDSESLKTWDIQIREVGAKRPLNGTSKVNRQTDRQTNRQTHRRTFRLIESIGPESRCFENTGGKVVPAIWTFSKQKGIFFRDGCLKICHCCRVQEIYYKLCILYDIYCWSEEEEQLACSYFMGWFCLYCAGSRPVVI